MVENIFEGDDLITKRLICGCLFPGHVLDVSFELADEGKRVAECTLNLYMAGKSPFRFRLKQIWNLLIGKDGSLADFILRKEDVPELIGLLSRIITNSYTSGTKWVLK